MAGVAQIKKQKPKIKSAIIPYPAYWAVIILKQRVINNTVSHKNVALFVPNMEE